MWKTSIFVDLSSPTEIRDPTLVLDPASVLLDPTKRGLRDPTLRVCKTQLAKKNVEKNYLLIINIPKTSSTKPNLHQPKLQVIN
jgi:hypothetical protein